MVTDVLTKGGFSYYVFMVFQPAPRYARKDHRRQASHDSKLSFINLVIHLTTQRSYEA